MSFTGGFYRETGGGIVGGGSLASQPPSSSHHPQGQCNKLNPLSRYGDKRSHWFQCARPITVSHQMDFIIILTRFDPLD